MTAGGVCEFCRNRVRRDLDLAPLLYVQLHLSLPVGGGGSDDKVSGTPTPPVPLRLILIEAGTQLTRTLRAWHHEVAEVQALSTLPVAPSVREGWVIDRATRVLLGRIEVACATAPDLAAQLCRDLHFGRRLIGHVPLVHRLAAPCPECDLRALVRRDGADVVYCRACHATWDERLYGHLARVLVSEMAAEDDPA